MGKGVKGGKHGRVKGGIMARVGKWAMGKGGRKAEVLRLGEKGKGYG